MGKGKGKWSGGEGVWLQMSKFKFLFLFGIFFYSYRSLFSVLSVFSFRLSLITGPSLLHTYSTCLSYFLSILSLFSTFPSFLTLFHPTSAFCIVTSAGRYKSPLVLLGSPTATHGKS